MSHSTVKPSLTPNRGRRVVENDTYAAFVRRIVAAHGRRIAAGDVAGLADLVRLADLIDQAMDTAVAGLRACGYSWAEIAIPLGISRQAAQQRWATCDDASHTTTSPERMVQS